MRVFDHNFQVEISKEICCPILILGTYLGIEVHLGIGTIQNISRDCLWIRWQSNGRVIGEEGQEILTVHVQINDQENVLDKDGVIVKNCVMNDLR